MNVESSRKYITFCDPSTGLFWDGAPAGKFTPEIEKSWCSEIQALACYRRYLSYNLTLVNCSRPLNLKMMIHKEVRVFEGERDVKPEDFAPAVVSARVFKANKNHAGWLLEKFLAKYDPQPFTQICLAKKSEFAKVYREESFPDVEFYANFDRVYVGFRSDSDFVAGRMLINFQHVIEVEPFRI